MPVFPLGFLICTIILKFFLFLLMGIFVRFFVFPHFSRNSVTLAHDAGFSAGFASSSFPLAPAARLRYNKGQTILR